MDTPKEVHITIDQAGWNVRGLEPGKPYMIYPNQFAHREYAQWTIGPIEVARILERLGIKVRVTVERSV